MQFPKSRESAADNFENKINAKAVDAKAVKTKPSVSCIDSGCRKHNS